MSYNAKVYQPQGGDALVVLAADGGKILGQDSAGAAPAQAAHIADAAVAAGAAPDKAEYDALVGKFNALLLACERAGILAVS